MKRVLLVLVIVAALATPLFAGEAIKVYVNGVQLQTEAIVIDGRTFVPLRAVSENMGAKVIWQEDSNSVYVLDGKPNRPQIEGDAGFIKMVNEALDLLEQKDFPHYYLICKNVTTIERQAYFVGTPQGAIATSFARRLIVLDALIKDSARYNAIYLAGTMTHETTHALNFNMQSASGKQDEYMAFENQLATYRLLGAPKWMQDECIGWESRYPHLK